MGDGAGVELVAAVLECFGGEGGEEFAGDVVVAEAGFDAADLVELADAVGEVGAVEVGFERVEGGLGGGAVEFEDPGQEDGVGGAVVESAFAR